MWKRKINKKKMKFGLLKCRHPRPTHHTTSVYIYSGRKLCAISLFSYFRCFNVCRATIGPAPGYFLGQAYIYLVRINISLAWHQSLTYKWWINVLAQHQHLSFILRNKARKANIDLGPVIWAPITGSHVVWALKPNIQAHIYIL